MEPIAPRLNLSELCLFVLPVSRIFRVSCAFQQIVAPPSMMMSEPTK